MMQLLAPAGEASVDAEAKGMEAPKPETQCALDPD
jgi:hypothetical protein